MIDTSSSVLWKVLSSLCLVCVGCVLGTCVWWGRGQQGAVVRTEREGVGKCETRRQSSHRALAVRVCLQQRW